MAFDLKVQNHSLVIDAYSDLSQNHYKGFLCKLDEMTAQMYQSTEDELFRLHQLASAFSKFPFKDPSIDRRKAALDKFNKSEHRCRRMNTKLRLRRSRMEPPHMQYMRDIIISVIGHKPNMTSIYDNCDFGPGSSVGVHGIDTSILNKLDCLTVTPSCIPVATAALFHNIHYLSYLTKGKIVCYDAEWLGEQLPLQPVQNNKITCVPKNAKTKRTIAIEPVLNGFVQKGIDLTIRKALYRHGIDLSNQNLNKALARLGSLGRGYATIDLSAASDSISVELVRSLLPPDWFHLLNSVRSPSYTIDNCAPKRYEKFCSMGNGFCFPLETLIFYAASRYAMDHTEVSTQQTLSVYGDDIIVPQASALLLIEVLRDIGFSVNVDKTFIHGDFRESCGADWFKGENVRPLYIKKPVLTNGTCYPILNELRRRTFTHTWNTIFGKLPGRMRCVRPYPRDDDSAINVPLDMFMSSKYARWNRDLQTWTWTSILTLPAVGRKPTNDLEVLVGKLHGDLLHSNETFSARFSERTRFKQSTC